MSKHLGQSSAVDRCVVTMLVAAFAAGSALVAAQPSGSVIALVGATVIDGNGGPPLRDAVVVIEGQEIAAVGSRRSVTVPKGARVIDAIGRFVTPGFIDTNVHVGPIGDVTTLARYWDRFEDVVLQAAQLHLKHGVTTIRDSYGPLPPLIAVRDAISRGAEPGPRMLVAGNIVGWGGPYSDTFSRTKESGLDLFQEQVNDLFTQGTGEDLLHMTPDELRAAINAYLNKGPDFIKYGGTWHINYPTLIAFSPRAQKVIVEETQRRGRVVEVHSTTLEGLWMSIMAGIDLIQHPEVVGHREITDELVSLIVERKVICSMLPNKYTGRVWQEHLDNLKKREERTSSAAAKGSRDRTARRLAPRTTAEIRREQEESGVKQDGTHLLPNLEMRRINGKKLIEHGAIISVGADNVVGAAPEFRRTEKSQHLDPGLGTLLAIEGLVELGMSPMQAIVAATKHGALAAKMLNKLGTIEVGKWADLLLLADNPLDQISNIRKLELVIKNGKLIDRERLPTREAFGKWSISH
jgi:imidazolonepropionase-like amidohydrolase